MHILICVCVFVHLEESKQHMLFMGKICCSTFDGTIGQFKYSTLSSVVRPRADQLSFVKLICISERYFTSPIFWVRCREDKVLFLFSFRARLS